MKKKELVFGRSSTPNGAMRYKQLSHIAKYIKNKTGLINTRTFGKINASGRVIDKPNWDFNVLTYEPNPDAAIHELAHLYLAGMGMGLKEIDQDMRDQFGYVIKTYGYLKQKRSYFEVMPMAMEQKIRRRLGLPASYKYIKVASRFSPKRLALEDNAEIAIRVKHKDGYRDLIRSARNLDAGCLERLEMIDNGELIFSANAGWQLSNSIDAKINRRARLARKLNDKLEYKKVA